MRGPGAGTAAEVQRTALWGDAFTEHGVIGKIFVAKKYLVTPSVSFQVTEYRNGSYIKMG